MGMTFDLDDPQLLFREDVLADPRPLYDELRREAPVWRIPGQDTYLVSDPSLVREVVGRPAEFSSNLVSLLYRNDQGGLVAFDMAPLGDPIHVLAVADPPLHAGHRKLLQPHLSPDALKVLEEPIRQFADEGLDPLLASGGGDVVMGLTNPLPAQVVCRLIGLPPEDAGLLVQRVWDIGLLLDGVTDLDGMGKATEAALELSQYVRDHLDAAVAEGRSEQSEGLLDILREGIDGGLIGADEALGILMQLIAAGTETTSSLMATTIELLARNQSLQERLRHQPELIPEALEDVLRSDGPFQFHYRYTTLDTVLDGTPIPANSRVLLMWAAANRPQADEQLETVGATDPRRVPHYAFGRGLHFCIGAPLARMEARVVIERLLQRTPPFSLDPGQTPLRRPSISLRRHSSLPIVFAEN